VSGLSLDWIASQLPQAAQWAHAQRTRICESPPPKGSDGAGNGTALYLGLRILAAVLDGEAMGYWGNCPGGLQPKLDAWMDEIRSAAVADAQRGGRFSMTPPGECSCPTETEQ
jgi:hypothetical protein